jgi:hypothetical protein
MAALQNLSVHLKNYEVFLKFCFFFLLLFSLLPTLPSPQNVRQSRKEKIISWQSGSSRKLITGKYHGSMPLFSQTFFSPRFP